jgi:hypothetical protein
MNTYRISAIILGVLLLLWVYSKTMQVCGCSVACPNKVSWWQESLSPGQDVPRPATCCPIPPCPACPAAAAAPASAPAPVSADGTVALNKSTTNTNTNDCSGATIKIPPVPGGIAGMPTTCMVPGKSFVVDLGNCTDCPTPGVVVVFAAADGTDIYIQVSPDNVQTYTGGPGAAPYNNPNAQTPIPVSPTLTCADPNQFKFTLVSDTQIDIYYNGNKIATTPKPSFQVATIYLSACASPPGSDAYGAFV